MNTVDILKGAKALIETKGWTQHTSARNASGGVVPPTSKTATCFCGLGAINAAGADDFAHVVLAAEALERQINDDWFPNFNDAHGRTAEEVIAVFDKAIAAEEARG